MVKFIVMFFARLIFNYRLRNLENVFGKNKWTPSLELVTSLTNSIPLEILEQYTVSLGKSIEFVVGFRNCHQLLNWIDEVNNLIVMQKYIDDKYLFPVLSQHLISLDDFLLNENECDVNIIEFYVELQKRLTNFYNSFDHVPVEYQNYYRNKLSVPLQNIYNVQEGLLRVAMNV